MNTITVMKGHGYKIGDKVYVVIDNGFWKILFCWLFQIKIKRCNTFTVTSVTDTTFTFEGDNNDE